MLFKSHGFGDDDDTEPQYLGSIHTTGNKITGFTSTSGGFDTISKSIGSMKKNGWE